MNKENFYRNELQRLKELSNLRTLSNIEHLGRKVSLDGNLMLNLSSNDYLGIAVNDRLRDEFYMHVPYKQLPLSSSSSRLLTGNYSEYNLLEDLMATRFGREAALIFSSGYHMNIGILPAIADSNTLILADKLVHASIIDGIRLSSAHCIRYRHQDYKQLEMLLDKYYHLYSRIIIVTESIFSMDGDIASLDRLVDFKKKYAGVMLYVDEAHAIGVRGATGLGIAEELNCIGDIDFLCGTFGKALASVGAYIVCDKIVRDYLINRMRSIIFTTALPPLNIAWTHFIFNKLPDFKEERENLKLLSHSLLKALKQRGYSCPSESHIVPILIGRSADTILKAEEMQRKGFYVLPVRPPTVPEGTSRLRISLTANLMMDELDDMIAML